MTLWPDNPALQADFEFAVAADRPDVVAEHEAAHREVAACRQLVDRAKAIESAVAADPDELRHAAAAAVARLARERAIQDMTQFDALVRAVRDRGVAAAASPSICGGRAT